MVMPRRLTKGSKRNRVLTAKSSICHTCLIEIRQQVRVEQSGFGRERFESDCLPNYLTAIRTDYFHGRDFASLLAHVQVGRAIYINTSFRKVYTPLGISGKGPKELIANPNHFVGLSADG